MAPHVTMDQCVQRCICSPSSTYRVQARPCTQPSPAQPSAGVTLGLSTSGCLSPGQRQQLSVTLLLFKIPPAFLLLLGLSVDQQGSSFLLGRIKVVIPCGHYGIGLYFSLKKAAFIFETSLFQPFREGFCARPRGSQNLWKLPSLCPNASKLLGQDGLILPVRPLSGQHLLAAALARGTRLAPGHWPHSGAPAAPSTSHYHRK